MNQPTINKCPSCGSQLSAFASSCDACGYEITNIEANRSITALVGRLDEIEREVDERGFEGKARMQELVNRRATAIRDFPVPNTREDLQQLIYFIQPKIQETVKPDPNIEEWRAKFIEVINRAKKAYENDSSALAEFTRIEDSLATSLAESLQIKAKRNPLFVVLLIGIAILCLIGLGTWILNKSDEHGCVEKYTQAAQVEKDRLDKLYATAEQEYKNKNYAEALTASNAVHWDIVDGACKVEDNQKTKALWEEKRARITSQIQANVDADKAAAASDAARSASKARAAKVEKEW
jgi:hypothetical protein